MRKVSSIIAISIAVIIVGISALVWYMGRDIPAPDISDLLIERPDLAADDNAFTYFVAVTNVLYWPTNDPGVAEYIAGESVPQETINETISKNDEMLKLVRRGNECAKCLTPEFIGIDTPLPYISPWRNVGRVMAAKARRDRLAGQYADAVDVCVSLLEFADLIHQDSESMIHYLVGIAILDIGIEQAQELARDRGMPVGELKRLAAALDELGPFEPGLVRAIKGERRFQESVIAGVASGEFSMDDISMIEGESTLGSFLKRKRMPAYIFQPNVTRLAFADYCRDMIKNVPLNYADMEFGDVEERFGLKGNRLKLMSRPNAIGKILYSLMLPAYDALLERKSRTVCRVDTTRSLVNVVRYERDKGKLPGKLADIVPDYMSAVPSDPYDGKPLRYDDEKGVIYSVGKDLVDGGGATLPDDGPSWQRVSQPDIVVKIR